MSENAASMPQKGIADRFYESFNRRYPVQATDGYGSLTTRKASRRWRSADGFSTPAELGLPCYLAILAWLFGRAVFAFCRFLSKKAAVAQGGAPWIWLHLAHFVVTTSAIAMGSIRQATVQRGHLLRRAPTAAAGIDASTGVVSGTIGNSAQSGSPYNVTVTVDDLTTGDSTSQSFSWIVTARLYVFNPGSLSNTDGDKVRLQLQSVDGASTDLVYYVTGLPAGLSSTAGGRISGTIGVFATGTRPEILAKLPEYELFLLTALPAPPHNRR